MEICTTVTRCPEVSAGSSRRLGPQFVQTTRWVVFFRFQPSLSHRSPRREGIPYRRGGATSSSRCTLVGRACVCAEKRHKSQEFANPRVR